MPPSKNQIAATLSQAEANRVGVLSADQAVERITTNSRKMYGFTRKQLPPNLPTEPVTYVYSISEYGDLVDLGPGFPKYIVQACPDGEEYGEPCIIPLIHFMEEAKVDVTEHTPFTAEQIVGAIMRVGPGMNAAWDRRKVGWLHSQHCPPLPEEVKRAVTIYTEECKRLFQEGERYARANQLLEINETHRRSAKYLGQKVTWDAQQHRMVECVGCRESIRDGAVVHAVPYCGAVQPGRWFDAVESGMKRMEDAPPEIRKQIIKHRKEQEESDQE